MRVVTSTHFFKLLSPHGKGGVYAIGVNCAPWTGRLVAYPRICRRSRGTYRGIATMYYTLMWLVLCYGLYDTFGKTALYVGAPILAVATYLLLPPG